MLIEHQPPALSLQGESPSLPLSSRQRRENSVLTRAGQTDWLSSLREIVRARNSEAKQQSSRVQQAGKNGLDVGYEARTGPEEVAGGLYDPYQQPRAPGVAASATQAEGARTASGLLEGAWMSLALVFPLARSFTLGHRSNTQPCGLHHAESERADASEALPLSTRLRLAASTRASFSFRRCSFGCASK